MVVLIMLHVYMCAQSCLILCHPVTVALQTPLSIEFSRQE